MTNLNIKGMDVHGLISKTGKCKDNTDVYGLYCFTIIPAFSFSNLKLNIAQDGKQE